MATRQPNPHGWLLLLGLVVAFAPRARADFINLTDPKKLLNADGLSGVKEPAIDQALNRASAEMIGGRNATAIALLNPLARQYPKDLRVWLLLSIARLGERQLPEGLAAARRCVEINPQFPMGYWLQGMILTAQFDLDGAARAYDQAVSADPGNADAYLQRGRFRVLYRSDRRPGLGGAIDDLTKALALGAPADSAHGFLGLAYRKMKDPRRAEAHFRKVLDLKPTHADAIQELTALYIQTGQLEKAEPLLSRGREHAATLSREERGTLSYAEALYALARKAPAKVVEDHFRAALAARPLDSRARLKYAGWLDAAGRFADTISLLKEGLKGAPNDPGLAAHLAWALADTGRELDEARRCVQVARVRDPKDPYLADTEAWIEYRAGNFAAAWTALQPGLALADTIPEVAYHAGAILAKSGERAKSIQYLSLALRSGKTFSGKKEAENLLERLQSKSP